jgi:PAS domain S-box-containing protein
LAIPIDRLIELDERETAKQQDRLAILSLMDAVVEALPDALIVTDADGKIVLFNERAEFMFGYHRSEIIGQMVEDLLPDRDRTRHVHDRQMFNRYNVSRRTHTMGVGLNLVGVRNDGHEFPVEITLGRMVVPKGLFVLALIRFSPRAAEIAHKHEPKRSPETTNEDPDAGN